MTSGRDSKRLEPRQRILEKKRGSLGAPGIGGWFSRGLGVPGLALVA